MIVAPSLYESWLPSDHLVVSELAKADENIELRRRSGNMPFKLNELHLHQNEKVCVLGCIIIVAMDCWSNDISHNYISTLAQRRWSKL